MQQRGNLVDDDRAGYQTLLVQTYTSEHIGCRILPGSALGFFKVCTVPAPECHFCVCGYHNSSEIHTLLTLVGAFSVVTVWSLWDSQHTSQVFSKTHVAKDIQTSKQAKQTVVISIQK